MIFKLNTINNYILNPYEYMTIYIHKCVLGTYNMMCVYLFGLYDIQINVMSWSLLEVL